MDESSQKTSQLDPTLSSKLSKIGNKLGWFSDSTPGKKTSKGRGKLKKTGKKVHNDISDDKENDSSLTSSSKTKESKRKGKKVLKENSLHNARKKLISAVEFSSDSDDQSLIKQEQPRVLVQDSSEDEFTAPSQNKVPESQCVVIPNTQCSEVAQPVIRNEEQPPEILVFDTQDVIPKGQGHQVDVSVVPESCVSESLTGSETQGISDTLNVHEESTVLSESQKKSLLRPIVSSTKKKKKHKEKNSQSSLKSSSKNKFYNLVDFSSEENSDESKLSDVKSTTTESSINSEKLTVTKGNKLSKKRLKTKKTKKLHLDIKFSSEEDSDNSSEKKRAEISSSVAHQHQNSTKKADLSVENLSQRLELLLSATRSRKKKYEETLNSSKKSKRNLKFEDSDDKEHKKATRSTELSKEVVVIQTVDTSSGKDKREAPVSKTCSCNLDHSESHDHSMEGTPQIKKQNENKNREVLSHVSEEMSKTETGMVEHDENCESVRDKNDSTPDLIFMLTNDTKSSEDTHRRIDTTGKQSEESNPQQIYPKQYRVSDQSHSLFDSSKGSSVVSKTVSLFDSEYCPDKNSDREGVSSLEVHDDKSCPESSSLENYPFTSDPTVVEIMKENQVSEDSYVEMKSMGLQVSLGDNNTDDSVDDQDAEESVTKVDMSLQCSMTSGDDSGDLSQTEAVENCQDAEDDTQGCQMSQNDLIPSMKSLSLQVSMQDSYKDDSVQNSLSCIQEINCANADMSEESSIELQNKSKTQDDSKFTEDASFDDDDDNNQSLMHEMKSVSLQVSLETTQSEASGMFDDSGKHSDDFSQSFQLRQSQTSSDYTSYETEVSRKSTQETEVNEASQLSVSDAKESFVHDSQYYTSDASNSTSRRSVGNFSLQVSLLSQAEFTQHSSLFTNDESQSLAGSQSNIMSTQTLESSEMIEQAVGTQESLFTSDISKTDQSITSEDQSDTCDIVPHMRSSTSLNGHTHGHREEMTRSSRPKRHSSGVSNASTNISFITACNDSNLLTNSTNVCSEDQQPALDNSTKSVDLRSRSSQSSKNDSSIANCFKNLSLQGSMISSDGSFTRNESFNNLNVHHIESTKLDGESDVNSKETSDKSVEDMSSHKSNDSKGESSADHKEDSKETSELDDDYLPDIDEPPISNKKQRRKSRSQRDRSLHRTPRATIDISDSSDDEDGLETFFQKMKTPATPSQLISSDEENKSLNSFIVSDSETSGLEDNDDSDSSVFYTKTNRIMDEKDSAKKTPRYISLLSSSDSDDDFQFKTPAVKTKSKPPVQVSKTVTKGLINSTDGTASAKKTPKSFRPLDRPNTTGHSPVRYGFLKSLSSDVTSVGQNLEAKRYKKDFKKSKEELTAKLFQLYNSTIFGNELPKDMSVTWNSRLYKTAGFCAYKRNVMATNGRTARIELSVKVCDTAERVRDTLVHELCHAAVWLLYGKNDGHGPYWKQWARKANQVHPDLPPIKRCHTYEIDHKYIYQCTKCGYQIGRHSKSLDTAKKVCGYCQSPFELLVKSKGSAGMKTPQTPRTPNSFALFVKANYGSVKKEQKGLKHQEVMKVLSGQFQAQKIST